MSENVKGRSGWIVGALLVAAVVIVGGALVLLVVTRDDVSYPPGSPEAAFQRYVRAWDAGDVDTAYDALTARARSLVPRYEFREASEWRDEEARRIWIDGRSGTGDRAVLTLTIETSYGGLLGTDRYRESRRVTLVRQEADWKIDTPLVGYYAW